MFRVMNNFSHEISIISEMVLLKTFPYNELISMPFTPILTLLLREIRGTQREYSSKPLKHSMVKRILVFKR